MDAPQQTLELGQDVPGAFHAAHGSETPLKLERRVETGKSSGLVGVGGVLPPMLDACCGSRMFWFDRTNPLALYMDKREEQHVLCDGRELKISPDVVADFTDMPFPDESFWLVVFDPPHMNSLGANSWLAKKYGRLIGDWRDDLREGFSECFRVLKTNGTLVFKWNTTDISLEEVLALAPCPPVFGHTTGRQAKTVWATFFKGGGGAELVAKTVCDNPKSPNRQRSPTRAGSAGRNQEKQVTMTDTNQESGASSRASTGYVPPVELSQTPETGMQRGGWSFDLITVCDKCLKASCWQGIFMCDEAQTAGIIQKTREELRLLNREHCSYWKTDDELAFDPDRGEGGFFDADRKGT